MQQLKHTKSTCHLYFVDLLLLFLFFSRLGESIYDPPLLKLTLLRLYYNASTIS